MTPAQLNLESLSPWRTEDVDSKRYFELCAMQNAGQIQISTVENNVGRRFKTARDGAWRISYKLTKGGDEKCDHVTAAAKYQELTEVGANPSNPRDQQNMSSQAGEDTNPA